MNKLSNCYTMMILLEFTWFCKLTFISIISVFLQKQQLFGPLRIYTNMDPQVQSICRFYQILALFDHFEHQKFNLINEFKPYTGKRNYSIIDSLYPNILSYLESCSPNCRHLPHPTPPNQPSRRPHY
ncbi:hypothetical protein BpHYR1_006533 [Brachionus plicatilis]|uniref:Uncharacterized protein n=1 Tax=Brachionus plicatilis TaxID=10195 RepID=A0A3M7SFD5_BRAPC|nr:hypothetical protein BpHYR1_006533 [Brachionus plicatilis]